MSETFCSVACWVCVCGTLLFATLTLQVAREVVWQKFSKLPQLAKGLLGTGDRIIAEATRRDPIWGIGLDIGERDVGVPANWRGTNVLGWALMQARDRLRAAEEEARVAAEEQAKTTKKKKSGPSLRRQQR